MLLSTALALAGDANEAWAAGDHATALSEWEHQIEEGDRSGDLYYNVGNAHYQLGELPEAILAWRSAQLLSPRDGDIEANLASVRKLTTDRIEPAPSRSPVLFWRTSLSAAEQGWAACLLMAAFWAICVLWRFRRVSLGIPAVLTGVPGLLLTVSTLQTLGELGTAGVVLAEAEVRSTASGGVVLFELHPGAEVQLGDGLGDNVLVSLPDGRKGWMPAASLGVVDPRR